MDTRPDVAPKRCAGIVAIPTGQREASKALGFSGFQSLRLIELPQALRIIIPPTISQYLNLLKNSSLAVAVGYDDIVNIWMGATLFKDTSLVAIIGLFDFLRMSQIVVRSPKWRGFEHEAYVFTALVYWVICYGMSKYSQTLENRLHRGHRDASSG